MSNRPGKTGQRDKELSQTDRPARSGNCISKENSIFMNIRILAFSGSLRKESYNTKFLKAFRTPAPGMQQAEFYLGKAAGKFNEAGDLTDQETKQKITALWNAFAPWIFQLKK
jgi:hypothetical protein